MLQFNKQPNDNTLNFFKKLDKYLQLDIVKKKLFDQEYNKYIYKPLIDESNKHWKNRVDGTISDKATVCTKTLDDDMHYLGVLSNDQIYDYIYKSKNTELILKVDIEVIDYVCPFKKKKCYEYCCVLKIVGLACLTYNDNDLAIFENKKRAREMLTLLLIKKYHQLLSNIPRRLLMYLMDNFMREKIDLFNDGNTLW